MKKLLLVLPVAALSLSACTTNQSTAYGALGGAALGAAVSDDDDRFEGALGGAAVGAIAGTLLGASQNNPGQCIYRNQYGERFTAPCR